MGAPRARSGAATSVHTHARPYPRGVSQGLVFCFPAYRLPCTPCYSAETKPVTIRLRSRTSRTRTSALSTTPASDRAWRSNEGANLAQYSRWGTLDSEYAAVFSPLPKVIGISATFTWISDSDGYKGKSARRNLKQFTNYSSYKWK